MSPELDLKSLSFVGIHKTNKMVYNNLVGIAIHKESSETTGHYVALVHERDDSYHIIDDKKTHANKHPITKSSIGTSTNAQFNTNSSFCVYE